MIQSGAHLVRKHAFKRGGHWTAFQWLSLGVPMLVEIR